MSKTNNLEGKTITFEKKVKSLIGPKSYEKLPKEDREVIREMTQCQEEGGPIGSAVIPDTST